MLEKGHCLGHLELDLKSRSPLVEVPLPHHPLDLCFSLIALYLPQGHPVPRGQESQLLHRLYLSILLEEVLSLEARDFERLEVHFEILPL